METTLIDFSEPDAVLPWKAIDDRVMGGVSRSRLRHDPAGHAVFEGQVSFDNGGGFASLRNDRFSIGSPEVHALLLEVRGDGRRYKLNLRSDEAYDGINYQIAFQPAGRRVVVGTPAAGRLRADLPRPCAGRRAASGCIQAASDRLVDQRPPAGHVRAGGSSYRRAARLMFRIAASRLG